MIRIWYEKNYLIDTGRFFAPSMYPAKYYQTYISRWIIGVNIGVVAIGITSLLLARYGHCIYGDSVDNTAFGSGVVQFTAVFPANAANYKRLYRLFHCPGNRRWGIGDRTMVIECGTALLGFFNVSDNRGDIFRRNVALSLSATAVT